MQNPLMPKISPKFALSEELLQKMWFLKKIDFSTKNKPMLLKIGTMRGQQRGHVLRSLQLPQMKGANFIKFLKFLCRKWRWSFEVTTFIFRLNIRLLPPHMRIKSQLNRCGPSGSTEQTYCRASDHLGWLIGQLIDWLLHLFRDYMLHVPVLRTSLTSLTSQGKISAKGGNRWCHSEQHGKHMFFRTDEMCQLQGQRWQLTVCIDRGNCENCARNGQNLQFGRIYYTHVRHCRMFRSTLVYFPMNTTQYSTG